MLRLCLSRCELQRTDDAGPAFTTIRVVEARHKLVECHGALKPGEACHHCAHFLDGAAGKVRCVFLEADPVADLMVWAHALAVVAESAPRGTVTAPLAVVVDVAGEAVGVVTRARLERGRSNGAVGRALSGPAPVVARTARLGAVARLMKDRGLDAILVADGAEVVGAVTRAELARAGVPEL